MADDPVAEPKCSRCGVTGHDVVCMGRFDGYVRRDFCKSCFIATDPRAPPSALAPKPANKTNADVVALARFESLGTQVRETVGQSVNPQGGVSIWITIEEADALGRLLRTLKVE